MSRMDVNGLLVDAFGRVRESAHGAVEGAVLTYRPDPSANSVAWLVWHLTRVQDDHVADVAGTEQQWDAGGWRERFGLPFADDATGYGQSADEVAQVDVDGALLLGYLDAVHDATVSYVGGLRARHEWGGSHPEAGSLGVKMIDGKGHFLPESKRSLPMPSTAFFKVFGLSAIFPKSKIFGRYHLGYLFTCTSRRRPTASVWSFRQRNPEGIDPAPAGEITRGTAAGRTVVVTVVRRNR